MPIISVEIMKTIDEREIQKTTKEKQTKTERRKWKGSYSERVRTKWFWFAFNLGCLQLLCKASFIMNKHNQKPTEMFNKEDVIVYLTYIKISKDLNILNFRLHIPEAIFKVL